MPPRCPHLPPARTQVDWRLLHAHRDAHRTWDFYLDCLEYGQALWRQKRPARALLCLDRAFGADLRGDEPGLADWPLPYAAIAWIIRHAPEGAFLGNPRVHFQHYADRVNEPRRHQRCWRSWACWALTRAVRPELPGDPRHAVTEPALTEIAVQLDRYGISGEADLWRRVLADWS